MKIVSVINYKGGVGKTTLTANLGAELAARGHNVLLLDLDPQTSLTFSFVSADYWQKYLAGTATIKEWFDSFSNGSPIALASLAFEPAKVKAALRACGSSGSLKLIASHLGLINVDLELATELGGASLKQSKLNYLKVHQRLADGLGDATFEDYDVVLIDCPPNFNVVTKTAIVASDYILIPAKADYLSTLGIDYLQRNLDDLIKDFNDFATLDGDAQAVISPQLLGVVFTMIQHYGGQPIAALRPYIAQTKALAVPVFDQSMRENKTLFSDAPQTGVPVVLNGAGAVRHIVREIEHLATAISKKLAL